MTQITSVRTLYENFEFTFEIKKYYAANISAFASNSNHNCYVLLNSDSVLFDSHYSDFKKTFSRACRYEIA